MATPITTSSFKVQEMSMQWLSMPRARRYIKWSKVDLEAKSLGKLVREVVNCYNDSHPKSTAFVKLKCPFENTSYTLKVYCRLQKYKTNMVKALEEKGAVTDKIEKHKTGNEIIFFFCCQKRKEVTAATTGTAWEVVRKCAALDVPVLIGEKILDPQQISKIARYCLLGSHQKEEITNPSETLFLKTSSLYYLVEKIEGAVKSKAALFALPSLREKSQLRITVTTAGLLRLHTPLALDDFPCILELLSAYTKDREVYNSSGFVESPDPHFEFLHYLSSPTVSEKELDTSITTLLFDRYQKNQSLGWMLQYKYANTFHRSTAFTIQYVKRGSFYPLSDVSLTLKEVMEAIYEHEKEASSESFLKILREGKLRFTDPVSYNDYECSLIDCLEGELYYKGQSYFKVRGMWYQLSFDFHALLHEDFRTVLKKTLLKPQDVGTLPYPWRGNKPQDLLTEVDVKAVYGSKGIRNFMKTLEGAKGAYVSTQDQVNETTLVGEILEIKEIADKKEEIEKELKAKSSTPLTERVTPTVLLELKKERKILETTTRSGKTERHVANPFTFPLQKELGKKEAAFKKVLESHYSRRKKEKEETYNRSYLYDQSNSGKPYGPSQGYLVFDQVLPLNIELCDVVYYTPTTTFLYHIKETFGQDTRVACSQIINGAKELRAALSSHQSKNFIQMLWDESMKATAAEGWRAVAKAQLVHLGKKNFLKIFYDREIVFVYAYLVKPGWSLHQEAQRPTILSETDIPKELKSNRSYLDSQHRLTGEFYSSSQQTFTIEGHESSSQEIYKKLAKFKSSSESTLAKLEIIDLAKELAALNFELKLCEIHTPEDSVPAPISPTPIIEDSVPAPISSTSMIEESAFEDWLSEDYESSLDTETIERPTGLINLGNTCYINAVLQVFTHLKPLYDQVEKMKEHKGLPKAFAQALDRRDKKSLQNLLNALFSNEHEGIFPKDEKSFQQDAHQFMNLLLDQLQWEPMKTYTAFFYPPVEGQKFHKGHESPCHHLSIALLEGQGFEASLNAYFEKEDVNDSIHPLTVKGQKLSSYQRAERITVYPETLIIHLKRFSNDRNKIQTPIRFPESKTITLKERARNEDTEYEIVAFINHLGPATNEGHYTADIVEPESGKWYHYNDTTIQQTSPAQKDAYIVILRKKDSSTSPASAEESSSKGDLAP